MRPAGRWRIKWQNALIGEVSYSRVAKAGKALRYYRTRGPRGLRSPAVTTAARGSSVRDGGEQAPPGADPRLALLGIVALAVVVRLAGIGDRLSDAEGYSWLVASAPSVDVFFDRLAAYENTPPLFYALLAPLPLGDEAWLRLPALLPAFACVPVLLRGAAAARHARRAAVGVGVAVAPFHVSYSNYSRGFMLAALGLLLAAWAIARLAAWPPQRAGGGSISPAARSPLQSEYDALLFLAPLIALPALWRRARLEGGPRPGERCRW